MNNENNENLIPVKTLSPFKHFCMTIGELPASYLDTMTYYEMLVWFTKYLGDTVIPTINNNASAVSELQNKYIEFTDNLLERQTTFENNLTTRQENYEEEVMTLFNNLQSFVNNYFENLDVQEEINNKLDEMVEDGTLETIIGEFLNTNALFGYNTVNDMLNATNLVNGSYARTLGYYSLNDGGEATYKITNDENLIVDNLFVLQLTNGLKAKLIIENETLNILQFGAKNDNSEDITSILNGIISSNYNKIFIPQGQYLVNGTVTMKSNLYMEGCGTTSNINISNGGKLQTLTNTQYTNINFFNLTFRVNGDRTQSGYAIDLNNCDLCKIERCLIRSDNGISNYNGVAFRLNSGTHCYDNKVINNQFQKASLHFTNSTDNFIVNNMLWADEMTEAGALVLEGDCSNTLISGNHFGGHPTLGCLRTNAVCSQLRIVQNYFDAQGIGMNINDLTQAIISDNIFFHSAQPIKITNLKLSSISNNTFKDCDINDEGYSDINITGVQGGNTFIGNKHYRTSGVTHTNKNVPMIIPEADNNYPNTVINMSTVWYVNYYNAIDTTQFNRNFYVNCYPVSLFTT